MRRKSSPAAAPAESWKFPGLVAGDASATSQDPYGDFLVGRSGRVAKEQHAREAREAEERQRKEAEEREARVEGILAGMEARLLSELRKGALAEGERGTLRKALAAVRRGDPDAAVQILEEAFGKK